MKNAQEIFFKHARFSSSNTEFWNLNFVSAEKAIEEAQKEAWNEAIESAAESATLRFIPFSDNMEVNKASILKLKK